MFIVAVTGRMGAGKSAILQILHGKNHPICRADDIARSLLTRESPCYATLKTLFGPECLRKSGEWDHKALARKIFQNSEKRKRVQSIIHPLVQKRFEESAREWKSRGASLGFYEIPLIANPVNHSRFDYILFVEANESLTIQRLLKKGFNEEDIKLRMKVQKPYLHLKKKADLVLRNEGSLTDLKKKAERMLKYIQKQVSSENSGKSLQRVF